MSFLGKTFIAILVPVVLGFLFSGCSRSQFALPPDSEVFAQQVEYNNKVDILWVVDSSRSMKKHQDMVSQQIEHFIGNLMTKDFDFHIGVTSMDMGSGGEKGALIGNPSYLTSKSENFLSQLRQRFLLGEDGSNLERGLESLRGALTQNLQQNPEQRFLRSDAMLIIIFLSDEDDRSPGEVSEYVEFLNGVKPEQDSQKMWMSHFIGVLELDGNCRTYNQYSDPGDRYIDLTTTSGGVMESICTADFTVALNKIQKRIVNILTDFTLEREPLVETLVVRVNGEIVPESNFNGWSYIEETRTIRFHGDAVPAAGASISIDFDPAQPK